MAPTGLSFHLVRQAIRCAPVSEPLAYLERAERLRFVTTFGRSAALVAGAFSLSHAFGLRYAPSAITLGAGAVVFLALPVIARRIGDHLTGHLIGALVSALVMFVASLRGDLPLGALVFLVLIPMLVRYLAGDRAAAAWAAIGIAISLVCLWRVETGRAVMVEPLTRPEIVAQRDALETASVVGVLVLMTALAGGLERRRRRVERLRNGRLSERLQRLSASIAHELNNPLAWMTSTTAFLKTRLREPRTPELDRELVDCATELVDGTRRLVQLSDDLRALGPESTAIPSGDPHRVVRLVKSLVGVTSDRSQVAIDGELPRVGVSEAALTELLVELLLYVGEQGGAPALTVRREGPHVVFTLEGLTGLEADLIGDMAGPSVVVSLTATAIVLRVPVAVSS